MQLRALADFLDQYLSTSEIRDASLNGLQVGGDGEVSRVALAVDASLESFRRARAGGAQLLIVHHGLFWGASRLTGLLYDKVRFLVENDLAVYAAHLPLDLHDRVGNNRRLATLLGLTDISPFLEYHGLLIGLKGQCQPISPAGLARKLEGLLGGQCTLWEFGPGSITTLGVCSGGAAQDVDQAIAAGLDCYVTGETSHSAYLLARDGGINVICAGHYATETLGVRALGNELADRFGLETLFVDLPTGL